jgi:hypothetical protein
MSEKNESKMDELDKYILDQAKVEIEHTRSWATKVLAFYVAVIAGIVTALFSIAARTNCRLFVPCWAKLFICLPIFGLGLWAFCLLQKNHKSYLKHRNMQIHFQKMHKDEIHNKGYCVPPDWFLENHICIFTRWSGWGFYGYIIILVTVLGLTGICFS